MDRYSAQTALISTPANATTWLLALEANASNKVPAYIEEIAVSFDGTVANAAKLQLLVQRHTAAGTSGTTPTPDKLSPGSAANSFVTRHSPTITPSGGVVLREVVHSQGGYTWRVAGLGLLVPSAIADGGVLAVGVVNPNGGPSGVSAACRVIFAEVK